MMCWLSRWPCSAFTQSMVVSAIAPWNSDVSTCCPRPVSSRAESAARMPIGTRYAAAMLGNGLCKKIGPSRHPGCSYCRPDRACTRASHPGRDAWRLADGYAGTDRYTRRGQVGASDA